jgi:hypothetical protein
MAKGDDVAHRYWERYLAAPTTQREADVMALKLFCLFLFVFAGLIAVGVV